MKKISVILAVIMFLLSACGSQNDINSELISADKIEKYDIAVSELLNKYKWNYDKTSLTYEISESIGTSDKRYNEILEASKQVGMDFSKYQNEVGVAASATLQHYNGDVAGKGYFFIVNEKIVSAYYIYNSRIYSLTEKNVFVRDNFFENRENRGYNLKFKEVDMRFPYDDYVDVASSGSIAVIDDNNVLKVCDPLYNCRVLATVKLSEGYYPMDFKFIDGGGAVLAGKLDDAYANGSSEVDYEENSKSTDEKIKLKSWKIVFLNNKFKENKQEISLDVSTYKLINFVGEKIFLSRGNTIDIFQKEDGEYKKTGQITLKHDINSMKFADIDGSGKVEAIITDGMDMYVYFLENDKLKLLWKSHLSIPSMKESLYVQDLNNDGVKEIYIEDLSDSTARYILDEKCFKTYGEGINYNYKYIPGDYNNDGKTDYIRKNMQTGEAVINLAEGADK